MSLNSVLGEGDRYAKKAVKKKIAYAFRKIKSLVKHKLPSFPN